jgi:hypothetical protein
MSIAVFINSESEHGPNETEQTTPAELEVFNLNPELIPALRDGMWRYMDYLGLVVPPFLGEQFLADRRDYPGYGAGKNGATLIFSNNTAAQFMSDVAGLPYDQAYRFCIKVEMAQWRIGLITARE